MVLESTILCFDNSEYQRNGDYFPTRLSAQKEAINLICLSKIRSNPENVVGLLTLSNSTEVLATLTTDAMRIAAKVHLIEPKGNINLLTGIRIAQLVLKHRQEKNHKMRLVVFVGSPLDIIESEVVTLAKRLKKEKVNADIISFGAYDNNKELLSCFIDILNGKDGNSSHLIDIPRGAVLSDVLLESPIIRGEDGTNASGLTASGFEFGVDPNQDPDLVLALRLSLDEEQARLERIATQEDPSSIEGADADIFIVNDNLHQIQSQSQSQSTEVTQTIPDFSQMTDDEQIAYVLAMTANEDIEEQNEENLAEPKTGEDMPMVQKPNSKDTDDSQNISESDAPNSSPKRIPRRSLRISSRNKSNKRKRSRSPSNSSIKKKRK